MSSNEDNESEIGNENDSPILDSAKEDEPDSENSTQGANEDNFDDEVNICEVDQNGPIFSEEYRGEMDLNVMQL